MTIRQGSKGTKDPAAANWDRVFGGGAARAGEVTGPIPSASNEGGRHVQSPSDLATPSPRPAELDPSDGA